jgi:hypothetical protein
MLPRVLEQHELHVKSRGPAFGVYSSKLVGLDMATMTMAHVLGQTGLHGRPAAGSHMKSASRSLDCKAFH